MFSLLSPRLFLCQSTSHTAVALFRYLTLTCLLFSTFQAPRCLPRPPSTLCAPPTSSGRHSVHLCQNVWQPRVRAFLFSLRQEGHHGGMHAVVSRHNAHSPLSSPHHFLRLIRQILGWNSICQGDEVCNGTEREERRMKGWMERSGRVTAAGLIGHSNPAFLPRSSLSHCNFKKLARN